MKKILIIDDEPDFCTLVQMQCIKAGLPCVFAVTISDGLALARSFAPDVIILDNNLPDGSGWSNAPQLLAEYPKTTIHLVTAKTVAPANEYIAAEPEGRIFVHPKPLSLVELQEIIA